MEILQSGVVSYLSFLDQAKRHGYSLWTCQEADLTDPKVHSDHNDHNAKPSHTPNPKSNVEIMLNYHDHHQALQWSDWSVSNTVASVASSHCPGPMAIN